jgi:hypothetical protein
MHKFTMLICAAIAVALPLTAQTAVQQGYLKSSVAEFNEPHRTKMLGFLGECRKVSDSVAKALIENDLSMASKVASPAAAKQWADLAAQFKAMRDGSPSTTLRYRNQALELVGTEEAPTSRVWYALTQGPEVAWRFLAIVVDRGADGHAGRVIALEASSYKGEVPSWLQSIDAPVAPPK